ncbi:uncharacterized protein LTR77_002061 [Saxophila tyrrhenica]|uniref:Uncharacterized protein n=1 Tax=Saxophila tyrrhenica TaxID=1690608 RepID=A0AAV9PKM1_9PEZI|nr:hypothetical protein LTR77_002061 [Saxophila tyrrhenica]
MHSRKRSSAWVEEDETAHVSLAYTPANPTSLPSKRLQNKKGAAVTAKPLLKYDAQKFLSNLAFTRFYVTANFQNLDQTSSFVVLCLVGEQNGLYQALCHVLPSLYHVSPSLQALAVTAGYVNPNATPDRALLRELPLITTACVDGTVVEEFEAFRREVGGPEGCIAVISPDGTCVWSSAEALPGGVNSDGDVEELRRQMLGVLGGGRGGDVAMGEG